jgi:hypothetical protein
MLLGAPKKALQGTTMKQLVTEGMIVKLWRWDKEGGGEALHIQLTNIQL